MEASAQPAVGMGELGQIALALLCVIGVILLVGWSLRRIGGIGVSGGRQLQVVAAIAVGARERIAVIQVGSRQILVGITAAQITPLMELQEPIELKAESADFARTLQGVLHRRAGIKQGGTDAKANATDDPSAGTLRNTAPPD